MNDKKLSLVLRPVRPEDKIDILEWDKAIWEGSDYLPSVFDDWLSSPFGRFLAAEFQGQVVGVGKLTRLDEKNWWLEGLRVDPAYEGQGVAGQIWDELLRCWRQTSGGAVRMMTMNTRRPIHHLAEQRGFQRIGVYTFYRAPTAFSGELPATVQEAPTLPFRPLQPHDVAEAEALALANPAAEQVGRLMDMGWQWAPPLRLYIIKALQRGHAWWWRGHRGLLLYHLDNDEGEPERPFVELLACPPEDITALLLDWRRLASAQGFASVEWTVHAHPALITALQAAGFEHIYGDDEVWAFELTAGSEQPSNVN